MTISPIARPSSPSVRFTAFDDPAITSTMNRKKNTKASGYVHGLSRRLVISRSGWNCLKNGTLIAVL